MRAGRVPLVLLVGPSHVGKTTVVRRLREMAPRPAVAAIEIDDVLTHFLAADLNNLVPLLPLTYRITRAIASRTLDAGYITLVSGTFTYVDPGNYENAEFHRFEIAHLLSLAKRRGHPTLVYRLQCSVAAILSRQARTERLRPLLVERIHQIHQEQGPVASERVIETGHQLAAEEAANRILADLQSLSS